MSQKQTGKGIFDVCFSTFLSFLLLLLIQVRPQSSVGMTLRLQLPQPACLQPGCSHSPNRPRRQGHRGRARDKTRVNRHRTKPSSTPHYHLVMDTLVRTVLRMSFYSIAWDSFKNILVQIGQKKKLTFKYPISRSAVLCWYAWGSLSLPIWTHRLRASCYSQATCNGPGQPLQSVPPTASA